MTRSQSGQVRKFVTRVRRRLVVAELLRASVISALVAAAVSVPISFAASVGWITSPVAIATTLSIAFVLFVCRTFRRVPKQSHAAALADSWFGLDDVLTTALSPTTPNALSTDPVCRSAVDACAARQCTLLDAKNIPVAVPGRRAWSSVVLAMTAAVVLNTLLSNTLFPTRQSSGTTSPIASVLVDAGDGSTDHVVSNNSTGAKLPRSESMAGEGESKMDSTTQDPTSAATPASHDADKSGSVGSPAGGSAASSTTVHSKTPGSDSTPDTSGSAWQTPSSDGSPGQGGMTSTEVIQGTDTPTGSTTDGRRLGTVNTTLNTISSSPDWKAASATALETLRNDRVPAARRGLVRAYFSGDGRN